MSWLSIIFSVLTSLPSLVTDIEVLINALKGHPVADQAAYKAHVTKAIATGDPEVVKQTVADCLKAVTPQN
jgi:hypothetical protein